MKPRATAALAVAVILGATASHADDRALLLAQACAGCHGQGGAGVGAVPAIAGLPEADFLAAWAAFRADERPATIMNRITRGYTDDEAAALAAYFAALQ